MEIKELFKREIELLEKRFPEKKDIIEDEIENSVNIYRGLKQDFEISSFNEYEKNWIKRCAMELIERGTDTHNIQSYSENGYSLSYYESLISLELRREVFPKVKTI